MTPFSRSEPLLPLPAARLTHPISTKKHVPVSGSDRLLLGIVGHHEIIHVERGECVKAAVAPSEDIAIGEYIR